MLNKDKLSKLQEKMAKLNLGQSGYWSPPEGKSMIRILPEVGDMEFFFQNIGKHYLPDKTGVYCPQVSTDGEVDCPICKQVKILYNGGKADKAMASELRVRRTFWMNILVRGQENAGAQIFTPGPTIFAAICAYVNDPEYGAIYDPIEGIDLVIERKGMGMDTEYQVRTVKNSTPVISAGKNGQLDEETYEDVMSSAQDLSIVVLSDDPEEDDERRAGHAIYVYPPERLVEEYDLDTLFNGNGDEIEEEEEEEIIHPVKKQVLERNKQRIARR